MIFNLCLCLTIFIVYIITHISKKNSKFNDSVFLILSFALLFFFVAFRKTSIGNDTMEYIKLFKNCSLYKWDFLGANSRYEIGYIIFNIILSYVSSNTRFFMIIMSLIFNYSVFRFIKDNSKNYLFSIIIYINLLFFYQSMSSMRHFFALSIILLAFRFVKEKKLLKYLIMVLLASSFHIAALVSFLIFPLYHMKFNGKRVIIFSIFTFIISIFLSKVFPYLSILTNRSDYYNYMIGEAKLANIILFLIFFVFVMFSLIIIKKDNKELNNFNLYVLVISALLFSLSINIAVLARVAQFIAMFTVISLPNIIYYNIKEKRLIFELVISVFLILYSSIVMIYRPEWNSAYNYELCINNINGNECK